MCCCCNCPEVEKTCWRWSVENGAKVVAVLYLIEGIILTLHTVVGFYSVNSFHSLKTNESVRLFVLIALTIFATLYFLQSVSSALLLVGLTIKEKTAFIRIFLIFNYFFIADDVMQLTLYLLYWLHGGPVQQQKDITSSTQPANNTTLIEFSDVLTSMLVVPFSIYSHILVSSHYKQVRRAITGPVQSAPQQEEGFVNKYFKF